MSASSAEAQAEWHTAEANVPTTHAKLYLGQLCRHAGKMGQLPGAGHVPRTDHVGGAPPLVLAVDCADTTGAIDLGDGRCILEAGDGVLLVRVEAATEDILERLQQGIAHRLETFGHRERLVVRWQPSGAKVAAWRRPRLARNLALAAIALVIVAAHIGVLGATLATARWTEWGASAILVIIVLKFIVTGAAHIGGGVFALRRGKTFLADRKKRPASILAWHIGSRDARGRK